MKTQKFYDLKKKKAFNTEKYEFTSKRNSRTGKMCYMIKTIAPSGVESYKIVAKDWYMENKK